LGSGSRLDVFQIPAQQQAVDVGYKRKMTSLKFILGLLLTAFIACIQVGIKRTSHTSYYPIADNSQIRYALFGVFCGECSGHCATMYKYNMMDNSNPICP